MRTMVLVATLVGAVAVGGGLLAALEPFESANAGSAEASDPAGLEAILNDSAPGAVAESAGDGASQISGKLGPEEAAEMKRAADLEGAGPNSLRCEGTGANMTCTPVPDSEVIPALKNGDELYGRTIYSGIEQGMIDRQQPFFEAGELVCRDPGVDGTMSCSRVDAVQPTIERGGTLFVTYKPYNVTFDDEGNPVGHMANPTVPLVRESN
jgi:hypothetical protein